MIKFRGCRIHLDRGFPVCMVPLQGILSYSKYRFHIRQLLSAKESGYTISENKSWPMTPQMSIVSHNQTSELGIHQSNVSRERQTPRSGFSPTLIVFKDLNDHLDGMRI